MRQTTQLIRNIPNIYITNKPQITRPKSSKPFSRKPIKNEYKSNYDPKMFQNETPNENLGMFERYYYDKLVEKNLIEDNEIEDNKEIYMNNNDNTNNNNKVLNIEEQINEDYEAMKKAKLKEATPKDKGIILPKSNKNFISENRKIIKNQIVIKNNTNDSNPYHKNYGKIPSYINQYKIEAEIKKELEQRKQKESKYPKGTRLLKEEERLKTLDGLINSKNELINCLEKLPISMSSVSAQKRKMEIEKRLDEIEEAIATFSRKEVFIKVD